MYIENMNYIYNPIGWDRIDPKVIEGYEIKDGTKVEITKEKIDPLGYFRFIRDDEGNRMSVSKNSLKRI